MERTGMSTRELQRAEVMGRVRSKALKVVNAAEILELSYRQAKRLWERGTDLHGRTLKRSVKMAELWKA